jgi:hypothetical protein
LIADETEGDCKGSCTFRNISISAAADSTTGDDVEEDTFCLPISYNKKTDAQVIDTVTALLNGSEALWGNCPEGAFMRKTFFSMSICEFTASLSINESTCTQSGLEDVLCAWDAENKECLSRFDTPAYFLNQTSPSPFSNAFLKATYECAKEGSASEAVCNAIGPAAPPDDQLYQNIAAAEAGNLTNGTLPNLVPGEPSGADGLASFAGVKTVTALSLAVALAVLLLA